MDFSPAFALLTKFSIGLPSTPKSEDDVLTVSKYLGVELPQVSLDDRISILTTELSIQNGFLSTTLESDAIYDSNEYRRSMFIKEVVANNRINRQNRAAVTKLSR